MQSWSSCSNRRFVEVTPGQDDAAWTVADVVNDNGMLSSSQVQEGGDGWTCQRALTARNNVTIDIVTCAYSQPDLVAIGIANQIAAKVAKQ
ncbi:lipoprotein LppH [Mycobacterium tuberculosis]|uniref:Lipoprotein LppH n=1 Tax=Mycobacterium tuberculosis TaxID=1773 RepID=A0A655ENN8_MYCTX|nr:lipoprotein LppH [Mycobacterium tuberculosis]